MDPSNPKPVVSMDPLLPNPSPTIINKTLLTAISNPVLEFPSPVDPPSSTTLYQNDLAPTMDDALILPMTTVTSELSSSNLSSTLSHTPYISCFPPQNLQASHSSSSDPLSSEWPSSTLPPFNLSKDFNYPSPSSAGPFVNPSILLVVDEDESSSISLGILEIIKHAPYKNLVSGRDMLDFEGYKWNLK